MPLPDFLDIFEFFDVLIVSSIIIFEGIIFEDAGGVGLVVSVSVTEISCFLESLTPRANLVQSWVSPADSWDPYIN